MPPLVKALHSRGIQAWGWQYIYGSEPAREAQMAGRRIQALDLDGFVIDAEIEYEQPRRDEAAKRYCGDLRAAIPSLPIALSSFRFPTLHMSLPWKVFLEHVDFSMPQVYWEKSHNPGDQLKRTVREFRNLTPIRPIFPTGAAYKWGGWKPTTADLIEYLRTVEEIGLAGTNFWVWEQCRRDLPEFWEIIAQPELPEPEKPPEPPKDLLEQYFDALNARDLPALAALYHPKAVHITAERTLQGPLSIRAWANQWLDQQMPNARFALTGQTKTLLGPLLHLESQLGQRQNPSGPRHHHPGGRENPLPLQRIQNCVGAVRVWAIHELPSSRIDVARTFKGFGKPLEVLLIRLFFRLRRSIWPPACVVAGFLAEEAAGFLAAGVLVAGFFAAEAPPAGFSAGGLALAGGVARPLAAGFFAAVFAAGVCLGGRRSGSFGPVPVAAGFAVAGELFFSAGFFAAGVAAVGFLFTSGRTSAVAALRVRVAGAAAGAAAGVVFFARVGLTSIGAAAAGAAAFDFRAGFSAAAGVAVFFARVGLATSGAADAALLLAAAALASLKSGSIPGRAT